MQPRSKRCRLCGSPNEPTRHHLIPQRHIGGVYYVGGVGRPLYGYEQSEIRNKNNVVVLCRPHHDAIEQGVYLSTLRARLTCTEEMHVERVAGREWLDQHYPPERTNH